MLAAGHKPHRLFSRLLSDTSACVCSQCSTASAKQQPTDRLRFQDNRGDSKAVPFEAKASNSDVHGYMIPYIVAYYALSYSHRYKISDFTKFSGQHKTSTIEHVNQFVVQYGEVASQDALRVRLFSMSLSGSAFSWFTSLPATFIIYWTNLEKHFHQFSILRCMKKSC